MTTDLFTKPTMKSRVKEFCKSNGYTTSCDLENFKDHIKRTEGFVKGYLRIHREARQLTTDKVLRRLDDKEKLFRGFDKKIAVYQWVG